MARLKRRTRALFHYRSDLALASQEGIGLRTLTGVDATFTRTGTATASDSDGTSYTVIDQEPRFHWVSGIPYLQLGSGEVNFWNFFALPMAFTVYVRIVENGTQAIANARVLQIGAAGGTAPNFQILRGASFYQCTHDNNDGSAVSSIQAALPSNGQGVEFRAVLRADGSVLFGQSINEAAETVAAASGVNTIAAAWSDTRLYINSIGSSNVGANHFRKILIVPGERSLAFMRTFF